MLSFARGSGREQLLYVIHNRTTNKLLFFPPPRFDSSCPSYLLQWKSEKYTHIYTNSVDMRIKSDWRSCRIQHKSCKCIAPVWNSNSLCAPYGSMESIKVAVQSWKPQLRLLLDRYRHAKPEEFGHCTLPYTRDQILELVNTRLPLWQIFTENTLSFLFSFR